jgi:hypothetical protein
MGDTVCAGAVKMKGDAPACRFTRIKSPIKGTPAVFDVRLPYQWETAQSPYHEPVLIGL